ncbi:hypothetical protein DFA_06914 [Cavenderia fasciculata]|uniref:Uncharacterized protein n=1 Tax=Cavenderia fasciculata TaxID=261658 RepID=F4PX09_CACFS|nr:hypothetical protein DFA_06914 [Cavenderia fasciculata]EGG19812.1 hypothetical protein DFA_06914 [Cavenderia fasciculata]|eukprot:XP_004358158.1 hypothetical protein DFA_06914 [Cavenderia fasciculata]
MGCDGDGAPILDDDALLGIFDS